MPLAPNLTPNLPPILAPLRADARWYATGYLAMFASSFGQTFFVALSGNDIRAAFSLSAGDFGLIYTAVTLGGALLLALTGGLVDRMPVTRVLAFTLPAFAAGAVLTGTATHLLQLIPGLLLLRFCGQGMMVHLAYTTIGRWFAAGRGRAVSIAALGLNTGQALLPLGQVVLAGAIGWRLGWIVAAGLVLLLWPVLARLAARDRQPAAADPAAAAPPIRHWSRAEVLRDPCFYLLLAGMLPPAFISNTIFFHQTSLAAARFWAPEVFASAFTLYAVIAIGNVLLSGHLIDRASARRLLPVYLLPFGAACLVLAGVEAPWSAFAFMLLYGITDGISLTLFGSLWPEVYGTRHLGAVRGVVVAAMVLAAAAGPGLAGLLVDAGIPLPWLIAGMGCYCGLICPVLVLTVRRVSARLADQKV
ncbi:MFS transporter [Tistrella mobilis]|uniref:MFS transporter n=1 Tax=Tistrella mobilis TaxID=171437 RepID=UPI0031F6732F